MNRRRFLIAAATAATALVGGALPGRIAPDPFRARPAMAVTLKEALRRTENKGKGIFGSTELSLESFDALPQWARVLERLRVEGPALRQCGDAKVYCDKNALKAWNKIISDARRHSRNRKLQMVNSYFNRWPYKLDHEVYGTREYWASPMEFLRRSGDCEDYAIAKFFALRQLGLKNEEMRVVILWDEIRALGHAVLAVYQQDDILVLDSLSNVILSHWRYKQYVPQYSMNETTRWVHVKV